MITNEVWNRRVVAKRVIVEFKKKGTHTIAKKTGVPHTI